MLSTVQMLVLFDKTLSTKFIAVLHSALINIEYLPKIKLNANPSVLRSKFHIKIIKTSSVLILSVNIVLSIIEGAGLGRLKW